MEQIAPGWLCYVYLRANALTRPFTVTSKDVILCHNMHGVSHKGVQKQSHITGVYAAYAHEHK